MILFKKNIFHFTFIMLVLVSNVAFAVISLDDPFIKEWDYFDGVNTYKLHITKSTAPQQTYHIDYTFPGGSAATDMCNPTSNISFSCLSGETVMRDDDKHSVKLTSRDNTYTFYDPDHMPAGNPIFGVWHVQIKNNNYTEDLTLSVLKGDSDNEYKVLTRSSDSNGNSCYHGEPYTYQVVKNSDDSEIVSHDDGWNKYAFKFDPKQNQITSVNPGSNQIFYVGYCISLMDNTVVFTKNSASK